MRVLFVSGIDGFCHRYEVLHRAEQLRHRGIQSTVRYFSDPRLLGDVERSDALFVYRTPLTALVHAALERARRFGRPILGSVDDLIFVPEPEALPSLEGWDEDRRRQWSDGVRRYRATLELCDLFVAPTEPLLDEARRLGWPAVLHRDSASATELALGDAALARREWCPSTACPETTPVTLGYFSGTATHDEDFAHAASAILHVLRRHPNVHLLVVGPLDLGPDFDGFPGRVHRFARVIWPELPVRIAAVDVNLAPLTWWRRFSAAKGEVKYIEAGAVGVPTVASPTPAFSNAITHGVNGHLARDAGEWRDSLDELVTHPARRLELGRAAAEDVRRRYSPEPRASELESTLNQAFALVRERDGSRSRRATRFLFSGTARPAQVALEPDACPDVSLPAGDAVSPPLATGTRLVQRFRADREGLCRVDVHTVTYGQSLSHRLSVELRRGDGSCVAGLEVEARLIPDRAWYALDFPPELRSAGRDYALEIRATGTGPGDAVSFTMSQAGTARLPCARWDDADLDAPLALRAFSAWPRALGSFV